MPMTKNGALLLSVQGNIGQNVVGMFEMPRRMQQAVQKNVRGPRVQSMQNSSK
ncbi:hypothetical protein X736_10535 [Mesorhizobium sp. L2C089B000]|nr:hypothetical protein X736_10535 [Mesorhizobium sp. L2C089B000]